MNLLKFEFKKYVFKPYVLILIVACTVINLAGAYFSCAEYKYWYDEENFQKIYNSKLKGKLTDDKINYVISETERLNSLIQDRTFSREYDPNTYTGLIFADDTLFSRDVHPRMEYAVGYAYDMNRIVEKADENLAFLSDKQNPYEMKKNAQIISLYSNRSIQEFYDLMGMKYFLHYDFSSLLALLLCILIIVPVFVGESETKMDQLLPSFKNGREKLVRTKIKFTFVVVFLISLWFSIWDMIGFALFSPLRGFDATLYALEVFRYTPLNLNIWQYILLSFLLRTLGLSTLAALILLASRLFKKTIYVFTVSAAAIFIPYLSQFVVKDHFKFLELINPALLIKNRYLFMNYTAQNFFNTPVSPAIPAVFANLILISIAVTLISQLSKGSQPFRKGLSKAKP